MGTGKLNEDLVVSRYPLESKTDSTMYFNRVRRIADSKSTRKRIWRSKTIGSRIYKKKLCRLLVHPVQPARQ